MENNTPVYYGGILLVFVCVLDVVCFFLSEQRAHPSESVSCSYTQSAVPKKKKKKSQPAIPPVSVCTDCVTHLPCWAILWHICLVASFTNFIASTCVCACLLWHREQKLPNCSIAPQINNNCSNPTVVRYSRAGPVMEELCNAFCGREKYSFCVEAAHSVNLFLYHGV